MADVVWLYYMERMGSFRALTALIDDYETVGRHALLASDGSAQVLEAMVRMRRMGSSSRPEDRESTYVRVLGWPSASPLRSQRNPAFANAFVGLVRLVLRYLSERRLTTIVSSATGTVSTPTAAVGDIVRTLANALDPFDLGRNLANTLSGLVWCIGGLALLEYLHTAKRSFAAPAATDPPSFEKYFPSLLTALEGSSAPLHGQPDYTRNYLECAEHARSLLLDVQALGSSSTNTTVKDWIEDSGVQGSFEAFASAHRGLPQADLPPEWRI